MKKLVVICGPTATGKTKLGIELAKKFNGEILSADSRQVYKGMDIGTGKEINYFQWGIDLIEPDYQFNVSDYVKYAQRVLKDIWSRGKLPIIIGGTGLYIKELLRPSETLHIPPNKKLRRKLEKFSLEKLQKELQKKNPEKWNSMNYSDQQNSRRLIRAIEIALQGLDPCNCKKTDVLIIGLTAPYKYLYQRIDKRVEKRIKNGMAEEKERLKRYKKLPKTLGYSDETAEEWKFAEHAYTRRQLIYFRKYFPEALWFDISHPTNLVQKVEKVVKDYLDGSNHRNGQKEAYGPEYLATD